MSVSKTFKSPKNLYLSLAVIVLGFNLFVYDTDFALSFGLFITSLSIAIFLLLEKQKRNLISVILAVTASIASLLVAFRANGFVQGFNVAVAFFSLFFLLFYYAADKLEWSLLWFLKSIFIYAKNAFLNVTRPFFDLLNFNILDGKESKESAGTKKITGFLKTFAITLIVVAIFSAMLSAADPIFAETIRDFREQLISRSFASLFIVLFFFILFSVLLAKEENYNGKLKFINFSDLFFPSLGMLALLGVFLFIQVKYLFGGHADLTRFDLTYSQYVRKGFTELLAATFFGGLIIYISTIKQRLFDNVSQVKKTKVINSLAVAGLFVLLASALKRDLMYIDVYGLTRTRVIGMALLIWLAVGLTSLLLFNMISKFTENRFLSSLGFVTLAVLAYFNAVNTDKILALNVPTRDYQKDYVYITNLSEDAHQGWVALPAEIEAKLGVLLAKSSLTEEEANQLANYKLALLTLQKKLERLQIKYGDYNQAKALILKEVGYEDTENLKEWEKRALERALDSLETQRKVQSMNLSERIAYTELLRSNSIQLKIDDLLGKIHQYQKDNCLDLTEKEQAIYNDFEYPFVDVRMPDRYYPYSENSEFNPDQCPINLNSPTLFN